MDEHKINNYIYILTICFNHSNNISTRITNFEETCPGWSFLLWEWKPKSFVEWSVWGPLLEYHQCKISAQPRLNRRGRFSSGTRKQQWRVWRTNLVGYRNQTEFRDDWMVESGRAACECPNIRAATCERKTVGFATACELIWTVTEFGSGRCQSREFVARLNGIKLWFARLRNKWRWWLRLPASFTSDGDRRRRLYSNPTLKALIPCESNISACVLQ